MMDTRKKRVGLSKMLIQRAYDVADLLGELSQPQIMKRLGITRSQYDKSIQVLKKIGDERANLKPKKRWSRHHDCCIRCERDTQAHQGRGVCNSCYHTYYSSSFYRQKMDVVTWAKAVPTVDVVQRRAMAEKIRKAAEPKPMKTEIKKGVHVVIKCWKIDGVCLTEPYDWPRNEDIKIGKAIDVQTLTSRIDGVPIEIVRVA